MKCIRWTASLEEKDEKALLEATKGAEYVFKRLLVLLEQDVQSSVRRMRDPEVCGNHALLSKEIGTQVAYQSMIEMINQIIKEKKQ